MRVTPEWIMIGAGPRLGLGLGLGHRQTQQIHALVLALDEVRLRMMHPGG